MQPFNNGELPNAVQLIKYHVLGNAYTIEDLTSTDRSDWPTLSGVNLTIDSETETLIDLDDRSNTTIQQKEIFFFFCSNGWLNKLTGVLGPYILTDVFPKLPAVPSPSLSATPTTSSSVGSTPLPSGTVIPSSSSTPVSVPTLTDPTPSPSSDPDSEDTTRYTGNNTDSNTRCSRAPRFHRFRFRRPPLPTTRTRTL